MSTALESWSPLYLYRHAENDSFFLFFFFLLPANCWYLKHIFFLSSLSVSCPSPALDPAIRFKQRTDGGFPELGCGVKVLKICFGAFFFIWSNKSSGLASYQLLPGHLSRSDFSRLLVLGSTCLGLEELPSEPLHRSSRLCFMVATSMHSRWKENVLCGGRTESGWYISGVRSPDVANFSRCLKGWLGGRFHFSDRFKAASFKKTAREDLRSILYKSFLSFLNPSREFFIHFFLLLPYPPEPHFSFCFCVSLIYLRLTPFWVPPGEPGDKSAEHGNELTRPDSLIFSSVSFSFLPRMVSDAHNTLLIMIIEADQCFKCII